MSSTPSASAGNRANPSAAGSVVLGALAVAAIPAGIVASRYLPSIRLLQGLYAAVPAALLLGLLARAASRRARRALQLTLGRSGGARTALAGRILAFVGLYVGAMGAIALGAYAVLRLYS